MDDWLYGNIQEWVYLPDIEDVLQVSVRMTADDDSPIEKST